MSSLPAFHKVTIKAVIPISSLPSGPGVDEHTALDRIQLVLPVPAGEGGPIVVSVDDVGGLMD